MTRRIGIIGAGPGGLAAAMLLAQSGAQVTIHERLDRLGGRSGTIAADAAPGRFRFDIGPTFFLYPQVLATPLFLNLMIRPGFPLPLLGLCLYIIGYVGIFFGHLIKSAVSRQR